MFSVYWFFCSQFLEGCVVARPAWRAPKLFSTATQRLCDLYTIICNCSHLWPSGPFCAWNFRCKVKTSKSSRGACLATGDLGSLRPSTEPKTPKPRKVSKKSPERSLGPPDPRPPKSSEKGPKSQKIVDFDYFSDFSDSFRNFSGVRGRGSQTPFGRLFETFLGFGVLGSVAGGRDPNRRQDLCDRKR